MAVYQVNLQELKALVVDDSRTSRRIVCDLLRQLRVEQAEQAEDGADAMAKLRGFPADLVVCDLHMTPLDGIEFTRLLRDAADSPNPYVPVLMMTADATQAQLNNALNAGVSSFMSKPVELPVLRARIVALFSRPMVFLREGRQLRPLRQGCQAEPAPRLSAAPATRTAPEPARP